MKTLEELKAKEDLTILAIESSCDETACAVLKGTALLSSIISSQIDIHKQYGGVVPEIASRNHTLNVGSVVDSALAEAGVSLKDIDAIAVTYGAGLLGALLVGVGYAKALAYSLSIPLIKVNHIRGHIAANYISNPELVPPYVGLIVSGGHTAVSVVRTYTDIEILGSTADDAAGEAFDKVARVIGLPYPGGPQVEKLAKEGKASIEMPEPKMENEYDFSYSGLKTAVINYVHTKEQKGEEVPRADVAASFQTAAVNMLVKAAVKAAEKTGIKKIAIAGGVGANGALRETLSREGKKHNIDVYFPTKIMCTDNAAMIAMEARMQILYGDGSCLADLTLDAKASMPLGIKGKR